MSGHPRLFVSADGPRIVSADGSGCAGITSGFPYPGMARSLREMAFVHTSDVLGSTCEGRCLLGGFVRLYTLICFLGSAGAKRDLLRPRYYGPHSVNITNELTNINVTNVSTRMSMSQFGDRGSPRHFVHGNKGTCR